MKENYPFRLRLTWEEPSMATIAKSKYKIGDVIKVMKCIGGHNYQIGKSYRLSYCHGNGAWQAVDLVTSIPGNNINEQAFELGSVSREDLTAELAEVQAQATDIQAKLDYLIEAGLGEFDQTEFLAYQTLKLIDQKGMTQIQKAQAIAKLIKS